MRPKGLPEQQIICATATGKSFILHPQTNLSKGVSVKNASRYKIDRLRLATLAFGLKIAHFIKL
jgi:hypothetical protein